MQKDHSLTNNCVMDINDVRIAVVGLGYVGLPLARLMATRFPVVGYDCNPTRVSAAAEGDSGSYDGERLRFSAEPASIRECNFYIIAVPTPVDRAKSPDLGPLLSASRMVGELLSEGNVVVYESTVYPGVTEDECVPVLEAASGLAFNRDFYVGYSPERVNPGDALHGVADVCKVTSGSSPEAADLIDKVYASVVSAGTYRAPDIRTAEAAKILENCQRDVNIAFMNEAAKIFNAMGIDSREVLAAASTKWNFLKFEPGLVGGHCISVDPYYLIRKAKGCGVMPGVMSSARAVNEGMGAYVAEQVVRCMNSKGILAKGAEVLLLGYSFKENCPDTRNTKVADVFHSLHSYGCQVAVCDPVVAADAVLGDDGIMVAGTLPAGQRFDAVVLCVAHSVFGSLDVTSLLKPGGVVCDVKGVLPEEIVDWRI